MTNCVNCGSASVIKKGLVTLSTGLIKQRYKCKSCGSAFSISNVTESMDDMFAEEVIVDDISTNDQRLVITSAQNDCPANINFLKCLQTYCDYTQSRLIVLPIKYKVNVDTDPVYDPELTEYLVNVKLDYVEHKTIIYGGLPIPLTAENPLNGLDIMSKGNNLIIPHPQVHLRTSATLNTVSHILCTTGCITHPKYSYTRIGEKAKFNHSFAAVVVEFDKTSTHIRHISFDEDNNKICDLENEYHMNGIVKPSVVDAIITGDEHVIFVDKHVSNYTYKNPDSMVNILKPKMIVRHDVLDSYSISHHHYNNEFIQIAKNMTGMDSLENELKITTQYIDDTTPEYSTSYIVQSNHNEHLERWLNETNIKTNIHNAKLYYYLKYMMIANAKQNSDGTVKYPNPFELVAAQYLTKNVVFVGRNTPLEIHDIQLGQHGDVGVNGSRGSSLAFSRLPDKMVVGHSHSPGINKGCYIVGTSSRLNLEYVRGASTWNHAHVIVHNNGKRQLIFITRDGYRL